MQQGFFGKEEQGVSMSNHSFPALSVVIAAPDCYETIRKTTHYLQAQTAKDRIEVVIVAPSADTLRLDATDFGHFYQFRVVEVGSIKSIGAANAAGIRQASAPVVALIEDHVFPEPDWAAALIAAHQHSWVAVGPAVRNGNPESLISWADFLIGYGPWMEPAAAGEREHLPGHNSSYKRDVLLDYGAALETMLQAESVLHWDLRAKGYRLYLEPRAKIAHLNFERPSSWLAAQFYNGRLFAATRSQAWSLPKRVLYAGGAPFIPLIRFRRILQQLRHSGQQRQLPRQIFLVLLLGLAVSALGEMLGYAFAAGNAGEKLSNFELYRDQYLSSKTKKL